MPEVPSLDTLRADKHQRRQKMSVTGLLAELIVAIEDLSENLGKYDALQLATAISQHDAITEGLAAVAAAISNKTNPPLPPGPSIEGSKFMRTFPEDRPADVVKIVPGAVTDSEGGAVDPQPSFNYSVSSSDTSIVAVSQDNPNDPSEVTFKYGTAKKNADGSFASATVTATVTDADANEIHEDITEDITLVVGAAANLGPGHLQFPGDVVG